MKIVTEIKEWQSIRNELGNLPIGFVPTMGNLHLGHLSLCKRAKEENQIVVVSIFVNRTQFDRVEDFNRYPRTINEDISLLTAHNIDYLFIPTNETIYPDNYQVQISEIELSVELEGKFRPGHFNGMLTIVLKLLNLIKPSRAYFGEKDYQQLLLIKKMVAALFLPLEVIGCPIIRNKDGLALSSRNSLLTITQQKKASNIFKLLSSNMKIEEIINELVNLDFKIDYVAEKWQRRLAAVWFDRVRLIDNVSIIR